MNAADILAGGVRLVRTQPKAVAIWGIVYLVVFAGLMALIWPMLGEIAAFQQQAQAAQLPPPPPPAGFFIGIFALEIVLLVVLVAIFAAAVRAVAHGGDDPSGFLRLGMDEVRLIGLGILLGIAAFVYFIAFGLIAGALIAATVGNGDGGASATGFGLFAIVGLVWLLTGWWAQIRLSLAGALTVLRGRIVIREAWRATRGRFWTLFGVYVLIGILFFAVGIVVMLITYPGWFTQMGAAMRAPQDPALMAAQQQAMFADLFGVRWLIGVAVGTVVNAIALAFTFGAVATAAIGYDRADHTGAASDA